MATRYTLIVGTKSWSSWSLRPYVALRAVGTPFEEIIIPLRTPDTQAQILKFSSAGRVPILRIEENSQTHTVWDSLAICETLAERHKDVHLWPDDPYTRAEARAYAAEMHSGFAALRNTLSMDFKRERPTPTLSNEVQEQVARIIEVWMHALEHHSDERGFLFGELSIADCMYAPVVSRFHTYGIEVPKPVRNYMQKMMTLPAMRDWGAAAQKEIDAGLA